MDTLQHIHDGSSAFSELLETLNISSSDIDPQRVFTAYCKGEVELSEDSNIYIVNTQDEENAKDVLDSISNTNAVIDASVRTGERTPAMGSALRIMNAEKHKQEFPSEMETIKLISESSKVLNSFRHSHNRQITVHEYLTVKEFAGKEFINEDGDVSYGASISDVVALLEADETTPAEKISEIQQGLLKKNDDETERRALATRQQEADTAAKNAEAKSSTVSEVENLEPTVTAPIDNPSEYNDGVGATVTTPPLGADMTAASADAIGQVTSDIETVSAATPPVETIDTDTVLKVGFKESFNNIFSFLEDNDEFEVKDSSVEDLKDGVNTGVDVEEVSGGDKDVSPAQVEAIKKSEECDSKSVIDVETAEKPYSSIKEAYSLGSYFAENSYIKLTAADKERKLTEQMAVIIARDSGDPLYEEYLKAASKVKTIHESICKKHSKRAGTKAKEVIAESVK